MNNVLSSLKAHWGRTALGVVIVLGIFLIVRSKSGSTAPTYRTATVTRGTIVVSVTGSGDVSTANNVEVVTQTSGVVKKIYVKNGDGVKVGEKIADIELDQEGQLRYQDALSSYQNAKNTLDGANATLFSLQSAMFNANQKFINGAVAQNLDPGTPTYIQQNADWLASEANYKRQLNVISQAQTSVNSAWIALQQSAPALYAPLSGTLTGFSLQVGSVITAQTTSSGTNSSQKIANVTTNAVPTISVNLTQIDVPKVSVGDKSTVILDSYPDKTFTGKVVSIDTVGTVSSGVTVYPTVIALDETDPNIFPNMSATANIITDSKPDVLMVPSAAIQTSNSQTTVRELVNGKLVSVPVEIGLISDTDTEITSGLNEGDTVVTAVIQSTTTTSSSGTSVFSALNRGGGGGGNVRFGGGGGLGR